MKIVGFFSRAARASRDDRAWLTITVPPRWARFLIDAGAQPAISRDSMIVSFDDHVASLLHAVASRPPTRIEGSFRAELCATAELVFRCLADGTALIIDVSRMRAGYAESLVHFTEGLVIRHRGAIAKLDSTIFLLESRQKPLSYYVEAVPRLIEYADPDAEGGGFLRRVFGSFPGARLQKKLRRETSRTRSSFATGDRRWMLWIRSRATVRQTAIHATAESVDSKTGLLNVGAWEAKATAEVARAVRTGTPLAVALVDIDRFKRFNDTYGRPAGDQVIKRIAATATEILRDYDLYDLVGRFGGEEFVILLPQTRPVDALRIAERIRARVATTPIYASDAAYSDRVQVTVSIGVATLDADLHQELSELLAAADAALYRAKTSGRDRVQTMSTRYSRSTVDTPQQVEANLPQPERKHQING